MHVNDSGIDTIFKSSWTAEIERQEYRENHGQIHETRSQDICSLGGRTAAAYLVGKWYQLIRKWM